MKGSSPSLLLEYSKVAAVHRPSLDHQGLTPPDLKMKGTRLNLINEIYFHRQDLFGLEEQKRLS